MRNHNTLTRDGVIKLVASLVGPAHKVNLTDHDLLIVVEVYQVCDRCKHPKRQAWASGGRSCGLTESVQNICGVSVLDRSFERLKRYSLAEIFDPSERTAAPTSTHTHMADSSAGTQGGGDASHAGPG
ncbi:MAG: hypothetical protein INR62_10255 [Rhodospirillales bacterium]|nr:hypothetical protein [Acetobacter sp.]